MSGRYDSGVFWTGSSEDFFGFFDENLTEFLFFEDIAAVGDSEELNREISEHIPFVCTLHNVLNHMFLVVRNEMFS
jgi:hypothetical protein